MKKVLIFLCFLCLSLQSCRDTCDLKRYSKAEVFDAISHRDGGFYLYLKFENGETKKVSVKESDYFYYSRRLGSILP